MFDTRRIISAYVMSASPKGTNSTHADASGGWWFGDFHLKIDHSTSLNSPSSHHYLIYEQYMVACQIVFYDLKTILTTLRIITSVPGRYDMFLLDI